MTLNDFLRLTIQFGLPTIAILVASVWIWLSSRMDTGNESPASSARLPHGTAAQSSREDIILCRMATIMLAVGFIFTSGICRLAEGGAFWLFLTLSMELEAIAGQGNNSKTINVG